MKIHHLNCGTMCPIGGALVTGRSAGEVICHCMLVETEDGLVLIETGMGSDDVRDSKRLGPIRFVTRPQLHMRDTALEQVKALGFSPSDVRHIILTHLDLDHAGGLPDFPKARVHVLGSELDAATHPPTREEKMRYRNVQWAHGPDWVRHAPQGDSWMGFDAVRELDGLPPEFLMIPLNGHTRGHGGVAVEVSPDQWLLHAGDAYFYSGEMDCHHPHCPRGLRAFQQVAAVDDKQRRRNQHRLRELVRAEGERVKIVCAHDPAELRAMQAGG
ncbi:MAG: MBL fold metallo-hydrolase [Chrysiogenetes bacterium]|nr:MBL fold metallo-hydrolase [Chrysiogenetes bacterium]